MKRLILGISGASGVSLAWDCLTELKAHPDTEVHLVMTRSAEETIRLESPHTADEFRALAHVCHDPGNLGAGPASGTFDACGMLVVPCSMKTVAGIHSGYTDNLLLRAADVTIKEHRPLVLCARESPLSPIHLRNLYELSMIPGITIVPPMLEHYSHPRTIEDMEHQIAARLLGYLSIRCQSFRRWEP